MIALTEIIFCGKMESWDRHDASRKNSGTEGSTVGNHSKVRTSAAKSMGSQIRGKQERCARRDAWELEKDVLLPKLG